jgi:hypothetical protein
VNAMIACNGVPFEIRVVAARPDDPQRFSHVYGRAVLGDRWRLPLDASHGKYPGWQVPANRQFRVQVYDSEGNPIQDQARATWDGLHGYAEQPPMQAFRGFGHLRGLGDNGDGSDGGDSGTTDTGVDSGAGSASPSLPNPIACSGGMVLASDGSGCVAPPVTSSYGPIGSSVGCAPGYVVLTNSGQCGPPALTGPANTVASIISSIASAFGAAETVTTCNAAGQCTTAPKGSAAATAAAAGSINSSYLLWGGVAIAAIAIVAMMGKK